MKSSNIISQIKANLCSFGGGILVLLFLLPSLLHAQDVIRAAGGTNLSIDSVATSGYTPLDGPTIRETSAGQLAGNETIILSLPDGYKWNPNSTPTFTVESVGGANTKLEISFSSYNQNNDQATFNIDRESTINGNGQGPGRVEIQGLEVRPTTTAVPDSGEISNIGTTGPDLNYGNLSKEAGAATEIRIETAADGSGQVVSAQNIFAGVDLQVYAIARDVAENFVENISLENETDWSLINITGGISQSALTPASNLRSATLNSEISGTVQIEANYTDLTTTPSETITVLPREADEMVITTQPSSAATAGEAFTTQPVIELRDQFGNIVTTDNSTNISASINAGSSNLQGTTTEQSNNGIITFNDLAYQTAETISLLFESQDLDNLISDDIVVSTAAATDLSYIQRPTNTAQNGTINPPVQVQLLDDFGNIVSTDGINVSIGVSGNEEIFKNSSTFEATTTTEGIATFDNLNIGNNATLGEYTLEAEFQGINAPVNSETFEVIDSGDLANFEIKTTNGNDIPEQEAGQPFDIQIRAVDGGGNTFQDFNETVNITADANISTGGGETATFTDGVLSSHTVTLTSSGETRLYAENTSVNRDGNSNEFNVSPTNLNITETTVNAAPNSIEADGNTTATITVQAKDQFGNNLTTGGETIEIITDNGSLSSENGSNQNSVTATDNGDGTYSATLTSSTNIQAATVEAFLNDQNGDKLGETTVEFTSGDLASFAILLPQDNGGAATQTAGEAFNLTVQALDDNDNIIEDFSGDLIFTSNSTISSGSTASAGNFANGELNHSITLTESGENITINVEEDNIDDESGTSEPFQIVANTPDATTSQVSANPSVIQNDGVSESEIAVTLKDQYGNQVFDQQSVNLDLEQIESNGNPSSGDPFASISSPSFNSQDGVYEATLTSGDEIELVEISATFNGTSINDVAQVNIVVPNTWNAEAGANQETNWEDPDNWSLDRVPGENDFVIIPDIPDLPILDLNVDVGSFRIEENVNLTLFGGNQITSLGNVVINGELNILDNTEITVGGNLAGSGIFTAGASTTIDIQGNLSLNTFLAGNNNSITRFNGETQQVLSTPEILSDRMEIHNNVLAESGVNLIGISQLDISSGNTFELIQDGNIMVELGQNITGDGTFLLNNNTFVLNGDFELSNIDASEGTVVFGIPVGESFDEYENLEQQRINNLSQMQNAVINNTEGVRTTDDIIVDGNLTFENGELIISSGKNLIAPNQTYNNGSLQIRRSINNQGWLMLGSPINSTFADLFDGLTTQGMTNSDSPSEQPNLLYYYESAECTDNQGDPTPCTDNQRWRTPDDVNDNIQSSDADSLGRGYFFYVFGNVDGDTNYNDQLPVTLNVSGQEYRYQSTTFDFSSVTYTASADTIDSMIGWNLVANPWASSIDWDDANWTKTNIDNVVYVWDPSTNSYKTWNGVDGSLNDGLIAPFQAFWVKANGANPELVADKSAKTTGAEFYGKSKKEPASIGFKLEADTLETETHITLTPDGSNAKDRRDGYRLLPFETNTYLELYTTFDDGTELAINNLARSFGKQISIPLHAGGFKDDAPLNGEYTLSWPTFGDVPDEWTITLKDKKNGEEIDLRKNTFYSFDLSQSKSKTPINNTVENFRLVTNQQLETKAKSQNKNNSDENRFVIQIDPGADGADVPDEYSLGKNYPNPFSEQTTIEYNTPVEGNVQIHIYDILGRKVKTLLNERRPADYHGVDWTPTQLASGVYIVVMRAGGKQFTKKLTFIK